MVIKSASSLRFVMGTDSSGNESFSQKTHSFLVLIWRVLFYEILEQHGIYVVAGKRKIIIYCYATKKSMERLM